MRFTVGKLQVTGLQIYLLDPAHAEFGDTFPGSLDGHVLTVTDVALARDMVLDASNGTDKDDPPVSRALSALYDRLCRTARR